MRQGQAQSRCRCGRRRPVLSARCSSCDMGLSACDTACTCRRSDGRSFSTKASAAVSSSTTSSVPAQTCTILDPPSVACKAGRVRDLLAKARVARNTCARIRARAFFGEPRNGPERPVPDASPDPSRREEALSPPCMRTVCKRPNARKPQGRACRLLPLHSSAHCRWGPPRSEQMHSVNIGI